MKNWYKRFDFYYYWNSHQDEYSNRIALIGFSLDAGFYDVRPYSYLNTNDTNRWKLLWIQLYLSRFCISIHIPVKKLPDYVPTGRFERRRRDL